MNTDAAIKFGFLGDLMVGGEFINYAQKRNLDFVHPFQLIESYLSDVDILFVNLEGPIFSGPNTRPDVSSILSNHPAVIKFLSHSNPCVLNLANNHMMDYLEEGLNYTLKLLDENNMYYVGAGNDDQEADRPIIIECKGRKIAFIAFTSNEPNVGALIAGHEQAGCASYLALDRATRRIHALRKDADIICAALHWGYEYYQYPSPEQIQVAHSLVDAGASYVIGHHPHVIQGIEQYKGGVIIYSLGNFFFPPVKTTSGRPQYQKKIAKEFMIIKSEIDESNSVNYRVFGGKVSHDFIIVPYDDQRIFASKVDALSKPLHYSNYDKFWQRYRESRDKELVLESLLESIKKLRKVPVRELLKTITLSDFKRNWHRFREVLFTLKSAGD